MLPRFLQGKVHGLQNWEAALLINKKKDKACIVLATNRNLVLLSKLLLSLQWKMLSLHTLMMPPCCTLHDDFPTTLTPIFFLRNSSELRGKRCTVLKCFKFPLFLLFLMWSCYHLQQISTYPDDSGQFPQSWLPQSQKNKPLYPWIKAQSVSETSLLQLSA